VVLVVYVLAWRRARWRREVEKRVLKVLGDLFVVIRMVERGRREEIKRRGRGERGSVLTVVVVNVIDFADK
jgi:hypothetical protein